LKHCPKLRELRSVGNLHCAAVLWVRVRPPYVRRGSRQLQGYALARDCTPVRLDDLTEKEQRDEQG
jgi:hypothetical protein